MSQRAEWGKNNSANSLRHNAMQSTLRRLLSDYGMIFVLLLLCIVFSGLTFEEQSATDAAAAEQLAATILARFPTAPRSAHCRPR